jgi:shikimate kinase
MKDSDKKEKGKTEENDKNDKRKELQNKLSKNRRDIDEILTYLQKGKSSDILQKEVEEAFAKVEENAQGKVFHEHKAGRVPISHHSSRLLHLISSMEELQKISRFGKDLHKALSLKCRQHVRMLLEMRQIGEENQ